MLAVPVVPVASAGFMKGKGKEQVDLRLENMLSLILFLRACPFERELGAILNCGSVICTFES
jgi:hypothetical protein